MRKSRKLWLRDKNGQKKEFICYLDYIIFVTFLKKKEGMSKNCKRISWLIKLQILKFPQIQFIKIKKFQYLKLNFKETKKIKEHLL